MIWARGARVRREGEVVDAVDRIAAPSSPQDAEPAWAELKFIDDAPAKKTIVVEPSARRIAASTSEPSVAGVAGWTIAVLALVAVAALAARKFLGRSGLLAGGGVIDVLARRAISPRQDLFLVSVGPRVFLVGASRDHLVTLGEFSRPDEIAQLRGHGAENEFRAALRESIRDSERTAVPAVPTEPPAPLTGIADELAQIRRTVEGWRA